MGAGNKKVKDEVRRNGVTAYERKIDKSCRGGRDERKEEGKDSLMERKRAREECPSLAHLQCHQEEQLVWQQDDCHRRLPTTATHGAAKHPHVT